MQDSYLPLLSLFLPDFILAHFEMKGVRKEGEILHLDLEEMNNIPKVFEKDKLHQG